VSKENRFDVWFDMDEMMMWNETQREKETIRVYGVASLKEKGIDPRNEKTKQYRRCDKWRGNHSSYSKEPTDIEHFLNKKFRKKVNRGVYQHLTIRPRDYKTYGWFTW